MADLPVFKNIPVLAAGQSIVLFFNSFNEYWNRNDAPKQFSYTVTFADVHGKQRTSSGDIDVG